MDISELERLEKKPHNEWTLEEVKAWLGGYAQDEAMREAAFEDFS